MALLLQQQAANNNNSSYNQSQTPVAQSQPLAAAQLDPNRDVLEEFMQPYLEGIKEEGDEVYFQIASTGKIYKIVMHTGDDQQDLEELQQNFQ